MESNKDFYNSENENIYDKVFDGEDSSDDLQTEDTIISEDNNTDNLDENSMKNQKFEAIQKFRLENSRSTFKIYYLIYFFIFFFLG